jgi:DNA-binding Xre family transcriptional regulator
LGTGGNHLEPDLGYTVDVAALKSTGVELHLLLLHLCEALRCRVEEAVHFYSNLFDSSF